MKRELRSAMFIGSTIEEVNCQLNDFLIQNHLCPGNHVDFKLEKLGSVYQFIYFYATQVAEGGLDQLKPFVERCAQGKACLGDIEEDIAKWHSVREFCGEPLHVFLGMTRDEYSAWVKDPTILSTIVRDHIKE